jgi:hypothetical protein
MRLVVTSACSLVTSAYDTWAATGQSSATETGKIGRQNLELSFDTARSVLNEIIPESELEKERNSEEEWIDENLNSAKILLQMTNIQRNISNWESLTGRYNWIPGQMVTFDNSIKNLKENCEVVIGKSG